MGYNGIKRLVECQQIHGLKAENTDQGELSFYSLVQNKQLVIRARINQYLQGYETVKRFLSTQAMKY